VTDVNSVEVKGSHSSQKVAKDGAPAKPSRTYRRSATTFSASRRIKRSREAALASWKPYVHQGKRALRSRTLRREREECGTPKNQNAQNRYLWAKRWAGGRAAKASKSESGTAAVT
jgi:hypothetical protein